VKAVLALIHTERKQNCQKSSAQVDEQKEWKTLLPRHTQNPLFAHPPGMAHTHNIHAKKTIIVFPKRNQYTGAHKRA
jgi:hypothetical protein